MSPGLQIYGKEETVPFEQLLAWASNTNRPAWQKDALRRLAEHGELTEDDLSALRYQIKTAEGFPAEEPPETVPLAAEHLSEASSDEPKTVLASLGPISNVDRLESGQPPMRFAVNGITLIYGPNASGKSGYCRITKQLCRSLNPKALCGNVYADTQPPPAEAGVAFRAGGDDNPKTELVWKSSDPPPPELARISVFDTASARVYVDKQRKIEFLPYELDLLNKLGLAARALDEEFKERENVLDISINTPLPTGYKEGTGAYLLIEKLRQETVFDDLPTEQALRNMAAWSEDHQAELDSLDKQSKDDPQIMARQRKEVRLLLQSLKGDVANTAEKLGDPAVEALSQKQKDAVTKNNVAKAAAHELFKDEPIPDVGSEVWRQMLKYAREFALEVFLDGEPPQIATSGKCVLCQQELDGDAAARLAAFDSYLGERAAAEAAATVLDFENAVSDIQVLAVKTKRDIQTMLAGYIALTQQRKENAKTIKIFFEKAGERLEAVKRIMNEETYGDLGNLDDLPASPAQLIEDEIAALAEEIKELDNLERDDEAARKRAQQYAELIDRKKLGEEIDLIVERRDKLEERHRVAACRTQCRLTAITQQITRRRREILTPSLKSALTDEQKALQLTHIPLDLADRGDLADSIVEVALSAQQRIANNSDVLSEGEQRGLALACFLAELKEIGHDHGIIVDDPVSSLDHSRMKAIARRLAEEAVKGRQVIVFTHSILFHYMLNDEARRSGIACHKEWITNLGNDRFGIIDDSQKPWQMKPVTERLQEIDLARQALEAAGYVCNDEEFRGSVTDLYTKMRTTWERVVEEILFNKAVQRFRYEVMTQRLEAACFDATNDYPVIFEGMKRTSHYSGHDHAEDLPPELPSPDDIDGDIGALRAFADHARARKKELEKSMGAYKEGVEAVLI